MTDKSTVLLRKLITFFKEEDLECTIKAASSHTPHETISLHLGADSHSRQRTLEISAEKQVLQEQSTESITRLQFIVTLPFLVENKNIPDVASLLLFINRSAEFPGFELNELENSVYFRYVLLSGTEAITKTLVLGIVGTIMLHIDIFSNTIENVGDGTSTFNELLEKIIAGIERLHKQQ